MAAVCRLGCLLFNFVTTSFVSFINVYLLLLIVAHECNSAVIYINNEVKKDELVTTPTSRIKLQYLYYPMDFSNLPSWKLSKTFRGKIFNLPDKDEAVMERISTEVGMRAAWDKFEVSWSLPILLSVIVLSTSILLVVVILFWIRSTMSFPLGEGEDSKESTDEEQWVASVPLVPHPSIAQINFGASYESIPQKTRAKGLLERRGSSASLTIDLGHPPSTYENVQPVTPTRECTAEEYLLSCSNLLSRQSLRSSLRDVRALHREFWDLPLNHPDKVNIPGSSVKNRYKTVIPNEATRVILPVDETCDNLSGYINANYIRGYDGEEKAFIATQGPMTSTVNDLWTMVWFEESPCLVMITRLWEKSRSKCEPYLPTEVGTPIVFGDVTVIIDSLVNKDGYVIRHITLQKKNEIKKVIHFWFDSWPDHKTPPNAHSLISLAKEVELARFGGITQRRPSTIWVKESSSPLLSLSSVEHHEISTVPNEDSPSKKRTRTIDSSPGFVTPLEEAAFRFTPSPSPATESVFWKFEKLSTNSTSSYDTAQLSNNDSPSDRSPFRTGTSSSYDSPRSKTRTLSSGDSSIWTEGGCSPPQSATIQGLSPRWLDDSSCARGRALGPVIVHCSAGIGRTGCFIAICIGVSQLLAENSVDILGIVCRMRSDRGGMVQTAEQYEFIHRALALFERSLPGE